MKKFIIHIALLFVGTLLIMAVLDIGYTKVYETAAPRTKFQLFRSYNNQHIDYAFLGSSRVDNDINPAVIEKENGKKGLNLGFQGSKLRDIYTMLQLFKAYHIQSDKIFIQVDYNFNYEANSNLMAYELLPFIRDNQVTATHFRNLQGNSAYYYIPFYRYCMNDYKIGLREVSLNVMKKKTIVLPNSGYSPVFGNSTGTMETLPKMIVSHNTAYDSIISYCAKNQIEPVFFCSPFSKTTKNLDYIAKLHQKIPALKDYGTLISDETLFHNAFHLNDAGATFFSKYLAQNLDFK